MFTKFAKWMATALGNSIVFSIAVFSIVLWLALGPLFHYSDAWQLVINTTTTIVTFLMVFLLQHTQNRESVAIHLKLDEIIRSMKNSHNKLLMVEELPDDELEELHKRYEQLANNVRKRIQRGEKDQGRPEV